ncbi:GIY-YIG nuclease family protein [archaeon]|jgi:putative endonuclease|nr:GIY-YIG nuclease family protein [archaeon]MBT4373549.1 GIY-YIG nuclease family protein [archaeon]MBT4531997.1 GIY-YIG nuclease family protein [archaeon]MBT7001664.1 GIY-YIG nuclease family protein [archaeon]MBT7282444.1 GIY-YIG nuclease family protein [archaeon]
MDNLYLKGHEKVVKKQWCVYILECQDGSFYTGVSNDVEARMKVHASGKGSKYVCKKGFKELLRVKYCESHSDACKCECAIKKLPKWRKLDWFDEN